MLHLVFVLLHIFTKLMGKVLVYLSLKRSRPGTFFVLLGFVVFFFCVQRIVSARSNDSESSGSGMGGGGHGMD